VCLGGLFFFFQAEDGIRDFHVTGVQTCALPISGVVPAGDTLEQQVDAPAHLRIGNPRGLRLEVDGREVLLSATSPVDLAITTTRSEERRVGKECRSRRWPRPTNRDTKRRYYRNQ